MLVFKILKTVALVFIFSFILQPSTIVFANDCQSDTPPISTVPGNRIIPPNWRDAYKPKIYSDNDEIARNNYVNVWVDSDGKACPPYSWSVSGTGFHFDSASGPTTATTNADLETLQLWADGTACGPATITVTDLCEGNDEEYVRCTNGRWVKKNINICIMKVSRRRFLSASGTIAVGSSLGLRAAERSKPSMPVERELPSLEGRKILYTYGGWKGHEPVQSLDLFKPWMEKEGGLTMFLSSDSGGVSSTRRSIWSHQRMG